MKIPFLDNSYTSRSKDVDPSVTVNLYPEFSPPDSKSQIALISRPGLTLVETLSGISRGCYSFNGLQYHIVGNHIVTYDGISVVDLTNEYSFPLLQTISGDITGFTDNGLAPTGGNQILFSDGTYGYVLNVNPQPIINVVGDGDGAFAVAELSGGQTSIIGGVITELNIPFGSPSTGSGSGFFSALVDIIGGNPITPASSIAILGGGSVNNTFITNSGAGYWNGISGLNVYFDLPDIIISTSTTSETISASSITLTVSAGLSIVNGENLCIANDYAHYMYGTVTSYTGTSLVLSITGTRGTGTFSSWKVFPYSSLALGQINFSNVSTGKITGITVTQVGAGYINIPQIYITGGSPTINSQAVCTTTGSSITGYTLLSGGTGYGRPQLSQLKISGPNYPTDSPQATVVLSKGVLSTVNLSDSSYVGYPNNPSCLILGVSSIGGGAIATAEVDAPSTNAIVLPIIVSGAISSTVVENGGANYSTKPIATAYDPTGLGSGAVLSANISGVISSVDVVNGGLYYVFSLPPSVVFTGGGYTRIAKAHVVLSPPNIDTNGVVSSIVIDDPGAGYQYAPICSIIGGYSEEGGSGGHSRQAQPTANFGGQYIATATANISSGVSSVQVISGGYNYSIFTNIIIANPIVNIGVAAAGQGFNQIPNVTLGANVATVTIITGGSGYIPNYNYWNPSTAYVNGQYVSFGTNNYGCILSNTGQPPTNTTYWTELTTPINSPSCSITGSGGEDVQASTYVHVSSAGVVDNIIIISNGLNYIGSVSVAIQPPVSGQTATATATLSSANATATISRTIDYVSVTNGGANLSDVPQITITDPTGTNAELTAVVEEGQIVSITVNLPGSNYTNPSLSFSGGIGFLSASTGIISCVGYLASVGIIGYGGGSTLFQTSYTNDFTIWPASSFSAKFVNSDPLISIGEINGYLALIGKSSFELWNITGTTGFPFQYSSTIDNGCAAINTLLDTDNTLYWLANSSEKSFEGIARFNGTKADIISTSDINYEISQMSVISDAVAYAYTDSGHNFYVITFPSGNKTYVFDTATTKWHRRSFYTGSLYTYGRELIQNYIFYNGKHYVTDYSNGNIYVFDNSNYTDNGNPLVRLRITPPIVDKADYNFLTFDLLEVNMTTNVTCVSSMSAEAILSFSDDSGYTFSQDYPYYIGTINNTWGNRLRATWRMLGQSQNRVFRLVFSAPIPVTLVSGFIIAMKDDI
jgi:hypothetical protein